MILSILGTDAVFKHAMGELFFAAFCAFFGAVYEAFSFGVFSFFMIYAFSVPLATAILLFVMYKREKTPPKRFMDLLHMTSVTAALGFIATGVVEIYGSDNRLLWVYPFLGAGLFLATLISYGINPSSEPQIKNLPNPPTP